MDINNNFLNISCAIQFKIFEYKILPKLFQQLKHKKKDTSCLTITIMLVET